MPFKGVKRVLAGSTLTGTTGGSEYAWYSQTERLFPAVQMGG